MRKPAQWKTRCQRYSAIRYLVAKALYSGNGPHQFLQLLSSALAGEDASNYLNKLVTETLPCSLNPYNLLKSVNASIPGKTGRIQKERPDIIELLQQLECQPLKEKIKRFTLTGFPNA